MALGRAASNLAHNLRRGVREVGHMVRDVRPLIGHTRRMKNLDANIQAVKLARETKDVRLPSTFEKMSAFDKGVQMARNTVGKIKRNLPLTPSF